MNGKHNGTFLGFPTANMDLDFPYVMPSNGVYIGECYVKEQYYKCLICVSTHPSIMKLDEPIIEVYILHLDEMLYGDFILVSFIEKIREIITFDNVEDLKKQLIADKRKLLCYSFK